VAVEFKPGRQPVPDELLRVTPSRQTLLSRLKNGEIKAALILGEDPMRNNEIRGFLENLRFLAVMAETFNETAKAADVVLPATNYLEEPGTRVNFEGNVYEFESVIRPPAERPGWQVLAGLAGAFGLIGVSNTVETIREKLQQAVREGYGAYTPFYWNTGEQRRWRGPQSFQRVEVKAEQRRTAQYLTMIQRYKYDAATIGIKHFRMTQPESFRH
jgi:anaerobic selenocysteine-containing dehydrogenase